MRSGNVESVELSELTQQSTGLPRRDFLSTALGFFSIQAVENLLGRVRGNQLLPNSKLKASLATKLDVLAGRPNVVTELDQRREDYFLRQRALTAYRDRLAKSAMEVLRPVMDSEGVPLEEIQYAEAIIRGVRGRIQLSADSARALFSQNLIKPVTSSTGIDPDGPGFRVWYINQGWGKSTFVYTSFFVGIGQPNGHLPDISLSLDPEHIKEPYWGYDFTRFVLDGT